MRTKIVIDVKKVKSRSKRKTHLNESDFGPRLIDLPHVELLVLYDTSIHLIRFVALGSGPLQNVGDFDRFARSGQLTYQGKDLIGGVGDAVNKIEL